MNKQRFNLLWQLFLALLVTLLTATPTLAFQACNSAITQTTPDGYYQDHGDGTVTNQHTELMWQKCSLGLSGTGCNAGTASNFTWDQALQQAETLNSNGGFAGHSDWRLPNVNELGSLVEIACISPSINSTLFPNTQSDLYWSSSPHIRDTDAWIISFGRGSDNFDDRDKSGYVRLVRDTH